MAELVADCPRCGAKQITFELTQDNLVDTKYDWQRWFEAFCICRRCRTSTVFVLSQKQIASKRIIADGLVRCSTAVNEFVEVEGFISIKDLDTISPPNHVPDNIGHAFREGATCLKVNCYNAASAMFRLSLDLATKSLIPSGGEGGPNERERKFLGPRLQWLFENGHLSSDLKDLSSCIKDDGNDGVHDGTLTRTDAEDLLDFTSTVLTRLYTQPEQIRQAENRRVSRRKKLED